MTNVVSSRPPRSTFVFVHTRNTKNSNRSLLLEAKVSQVWVGGKCRWDGTNAGTDDDDGGGGGGRSDNNEYGKRASPSPSPSPSTTASLSGSGMPGKNGPKKRKRGGSAATTGGRGGTGGGVANPPNNNPWLAGGIGRMGRCRCCS